MQQLENAITGLRSICDLQREAFEVVKEENATLKKQNELMRAKIDQLLNSPSGSSTDSTSRQENSNEQKSTNDSSSMVGWDSYVLEGPTGECKVEKEHDMSILYFVDSGANTVAVLEPELKKLGVDPHLIEIHDSATSMSLEQTIANTHLLVVILSRDCLKQRSLVFGMECAGIYPSIQLALLHDPATCRFPGYDEQPESVRAFFSEKAITYLQDYVDSVASQLVGKVHEKKQKEQTKAVSHANSAPEDIRTRLFLSHKRLTAQAIAGRLYEGLKKHYHIFLDSEAHFKIHDLEAIVNNTKNLLFILSAGILDSLWCIKELRSAIKAGKKIIVVREYSYRLPDYFPVDLLDIEEPLKNAPTLTWMAEYNNQCVQKLIDDVIGPDDSFIAEMEKWLSEPVNQHAKTLVVDHNYSNTHLDLTNWKRSIQDFLKGAILYFGFSPISIESLTAFYNATMDEACLGYMFKHFPNLKSLNVQGCVLSDRSLKILSASKLEELVLNKAITSLSREDLLCDLAANLPLKSLSLQCCPIVTMPFLQKLVAPRALHRLDLARCPSIDDAALELISEHLTDTLEEISLFLNSKVTNKGLRALARCRWLISVNLRGCTAVTDDGLGALLDSSTKLEYLDVQGLQSISGTPFNSISSELLELHAENTNLDDSALKSIGSRCSKLTSIHLDFCKQISNVGLQYLADCHSLKSVGLAGTKITNEGVIQMIKGCPNILYLHTEICPVNQQLVDIVKDYCKNIKYIPFVHSVPDWEADPKYKHHMSAPLFDETGLVLWMKAEDVSNYATIEEEVAGWNDSWTSGLNFTWAADKIGAKMVTKPVLTYLPSDVNKAPNTYAMKFIGTAKLAAERTTVNLIHNDFTIFLVKKNVTPSNANYYFFTINTHGNPTESVGKLHLYEGSTPHTSKFIVQATGKWTADYLNLPATFPTGDLHVMIYQRKGSMMRFWQHGHQVQERNGSAGPLLTKSTYTYTIGDDQAFGASIDSILSPTYLSEMIVFNQALSDERLLEMKFYLQQKYQFKASLI